VSRLTVERLFDSPSLSGTLPSDVRFSPDGAFVTYLANPPEDRNRTDLYCYDVAVGASRRWIDAGSVTAVGEPTAAEKAENERRRAFSSGVTAHRWLPDGHRVCCAIDGALFLFDRIGGALRPITPPGARQTGTTVAGGGRHISYVRDGDVYAYDVERGVEERLTDDARDGVTNGLAEFIAQEEMHRFEGHWWSTDGRFLVFTRVDETAIPTTHRYEFTATALVAYPQRYPYAGGNNARVELAVLDIATRSTRWIEWRHADDDYLARVDVGRDRIVVQSQRREQRELTVTEYPLDGGPPRELLTERHTTWLNLHDNFRFVGSDGFLWTSERAGSSQLYLHRSGTAPLLLSSGRGRVHQVVHADTTHAWFVGWLDRPTEQHLYRVAYESPGRVEAMTSVPGWHDAAVDPTGRLFLDRSSSVGQPPRLELRSVDDSRNIALSPNEVAEGHPYFEFRDSHAVPEFGRIAAADGQDLWFRLTRPRTTGIGSRVPVLVNVYGGPGVQRVKNEWSPLTNQLFVNAGIAVFELDNRGGGNREKAFEDPLFGRLGAIEVADQQAGIDYLKRQPWVDANRIAVIGHSYGGFMTLMLLAHNRGDIRAGVSTAPVTDWRLYDTHYTERYLGTPRTNAVGYRDSCVLTWVDRISGKLLLMHGMADDNVLFGHTSALMQALQARHFEFELMLYPGAKHALQDRDVSIHRYRTILEFLRRELLS
jgi:dipeptidyl-peptidase-4